MNSVRFSNLHAAAAAAFPRELVQNTCSRKTLVLTQHRNCRGTVLQPRKIHGCRISNSTNSGGEGSVSTTTSSSSWISRNGEKFDLKEYWDGMISEVEEELSKAVESRYPQKIHESMKYSVMAPRAKRAAPIMCVAACEAVGGSKAQALPAACALEMVHAASLIHDDLPCMDNDMLRRGLPSNHSIFGEAMAVLAGDALFPLAFEFLVSSSSAMIPPQTLVRLVSAIARTVGSQGMASGQLVDLLSTDKSKLDPALLKYIYEKKFGVLAECSAVCGGLVGGATKEQLEKLQNYGRCVGVLYQIVDDIIEDEAMLKENGVAEKSKKTTYPKAYGLDKAREIAETLRATAKEQLSGFDRARTTPLYSFVDYAIERKFNNV